MPDTSLEPEAIDALISSAADASDGTDEIVPLSSASYSGNGDLSSLVGGTVANAHVPEPAAQHARGRFFFLTTKSKRAYFDVSFSAGDFLVFGRETKGLPESLLTKHREELLTIPMRGTRSLNLATAVGIVLFEAMRQQQRSA